MSDIEFTEELKNTIFNADPKVDRTELLEHIFKSYVAKLFEMVLGRKEKQRIELGAMVEIKNNLIREFRAAELSEYQKSVKWYEELFDKTIQEIFNDAANAHQGIDSVSRELKNLEVNPDAYVNDGGLYVPSHMKRR